MGDAVDLTDVSIQKIFLKQGTLEEGKELFPKYANVDTGVTDYYLKDSSLSGLGTAARIVENAVITAEVPIQGFDQTYTQVEYGKLLPVTKQMWKFGIKKRDLEKVSGALRLACRRSKEELMAERLDNSFSTSYTRSDDAGNYTVTTTGGDAVALVSASHTREDGGTANNNRITDGTTVNMDFDYDAIKAAHRTASLVLDPKGKQMELDVDTFIFKKGVSNAFRAQEILGAIRAGGKASIPGSADNDSAGVPAFSVVELPHISTNTAYWFALDSSTKGDMSGLQYKESQPVQLEGPNVVFKTGEIQYKATYMAAMGHNDYRGLFGSKNTNAS